MSALKPWYQVVAPREDLRSDRPLDASEFAVQLDDLRRCTARDDYQDPARFFRRTYFTEHLRALASQVLRRLSGSAVESSAVYSLLTQFGGGKTHAMAMLYHLAHGGGAASGWSGVREILDLAGLRSAPEARTAIFVGLDFDPLEGRSEDGVTRYTPWGEIAWQLGGAASYEVVARHDRERIAPAGDVIRKMLPDGAPVLILIDELMSFVGRHGTSKESGRVSGQLYHFLQSLSEVARGSERVVLVASLQGSPGETTPSQVTDLQHFQKMFDRLGKSMFLSVEDQSAEIIRRRLFDWDDVDARQLERTVDHWADALEQHRAQLPAWFPVERARERFKATFPFHPSVITVFERKWRSLPRFQQTRGILRLLALWISRAYSTAKLPGARKDSLLTLGGAPLDSALFRGAVLEQLGETKLEAVVTGDITGHADSIADRLDRRGTDAQRQQQIHRKAATAVFFESNGGQLKQTARGPEVHLALIEPDHDVLNIESALGELVQRCHYLSQDATGYHFDTKPNLNKILADLQNTVRMEDVSQLVRKEVQAIVAPERGTQAIFYPTSSSQIPDQPRITFVVLEPSVDDGDRRAWMCEATQSAGDRPRTFKSALVFLVPESPRALYERAREVLVCDAAEEGYGLDDAQLTQLAEFRRRAIKELRNVVWSTYRGVATLGADKKLQVHSVQLHPSASEKLIDNVIDQLKLLDVVQSSVSPSFLLRKWPPALREWSTRGVRDAFFQSPEFPRLMQPDAVRDVIARGVSSGDFALVTKREGEGYLSFKWRETVSVADIDVNDDLFLLRREDASAWRAAQEHVSAKPEELPPPPQIGAESGLRSPPPDSPPVVDGNETVSATRSNVTSMQWSGEMPALTWAKAYNKLLAPYVIGGGLRVQVTIEVSPPGGLSVQQVDEFRRVLEALGLPSVVKTER